MKDAVRRVIEFKNVDGKSYALEEDIATLFVRPMSETIRVILADDHIVVLQGLRGLFEQEEDIQVVALVQDRDELLDCLELMEADVLVLDPEMPYHGLTALEEIRKRDLPVRVVVLTAFGEGSSIQSAL